MTPYIELNRDQFEKTLLLVRKFQNELYPVADVPPVATMRINGIGMFTDNTGSLTYELTYRVNEKNRTIDIHFEPIGFAVIKYQGLPTFDLTAKIGDTIFDQVKFIKYPKDPRAFLFLTSKTGNDFNGTNAEYIMFMCHTAMYIMSVFPYAMDTVIHGDKVHFTPKKDFIEIATNGMRETAKKANIERIMNGWDCINLKWEQLERIFRSFTNEEVNKSYFTPALEHFCARLKMGNITIMFFYDINIRTNKLTISFITGEYLEHSGIKIPKFALHFAPITNPITGDVSLNYWYDTEKDIPEYVRNQLEEAHISAEDGSNWSLLETIVRTFLYINHFMLHYKDEAMTIVEKECKPSTNVRKSKHHNRNTVHMFKSYTLKKDWKAQVKRKRAEIHCLAWGVRGHFRHYKSGKTIFVNAYVKGKERGKYQGKDYALLPQDAN